LLEVARICRILYLATANVTSELRVNEEREVGGSERDYGWAEQNLSSVLKVPSHCPFVLPVSVSF
jgi:hypothetical protein